MGSGRIVQGAIRKIGDNSALRSPSMEYYVSWGAVELPEAQDHYLERLVLLNAAVPHQYYEKRHDENGKSAVNGGIFKVLAKCSNYAFKSILDDGHW